jgi:hypothetical protein
LDINQKVQDNSEGCSYGYQYQAKKYMDIIKNIQGSRDINKSPKKYYNLDQSRVNGLSIWIKVKRHIHCSLKTYEQLKYKTLGIFL